jgi:hypothetical protein
VISDTGGQVEYWAQYGTTTAYGSATAHKTVNVAQNAPTEVTVEIDGLQRATVYHFRLCAQDSQQTGGPGCGADRSFTTQSAGCGETITSDVKLTANLFCPQEPGFVIGADGVEVDLAHHDIDGGISVGGGGPIAIDNRGGFEDVTVRDGGLIGFGNAFTSHDASRNRILDVNASVAGFAIQIEGGQDNELRRSYVFGRGGAITGLHSDGLVIADTSASSTFFGGIDVSGTGVRVVRNDLSEGGPPTRVAAGIALSGNASRVAYNHVEGWALGGISVSGSDNAIVGNQALNNILPLMTEPPAALGDGIFVSAFAARTLLRGNVASRNAGDGIETQSPARLQENTANDNGDFGIDAAPGSTDLGGNTASGNGNPLQCRNLFCG